MSKMNGWDLAFFDICQIYRHSEVYGTKNRITNICILKKRHAFPFKAFFYIFLIYFSQFNDVYSKEKYSEET